MMSDEIPIGPNPCRRCGGEYGEHDKGCSSLAAPAGYSVRTLNPREGDWVEHGDARIDVRAVGDGQVWYGVQWQGAKMDGQMSLDDWPRVIEHAISTGAVFHTA